MVTKIMIHRALVCLSFQLLNIARAQVNSEIFTDEDLLAIDSVSSGPTFVAPPSGFSRPVLNAVPAPIGRPAKPVDQPALRPHLARPQLHGPRQNTGLASGLTNAEPTVLESNMNEDGSYSFRYQTFDGQMREEQGEMLGGGELSVRGSWSYLGPDGLPRTVVYTADANGFRPRILKGAETPRRQRSLNLVRSKRRRPLIRRRRPRRQFRVRKHI